MARTPKATTKKATTRKAAAKPKARRTATKSRTAKATAVKKEAPVAVRKVSEPETSTLLEPFVSLRRQIDEMFEDAFGRFPSFHFPRIEWPAFPKIESEADLAIARFDFSESDDVVTVTADAPGLTDEDVEVSIENGVLTVKGEKSSEREEKDESFYLSERRFGSFSRSFRLPEGVKQDEITAKFDKGVLTVTMPKVPTEKVTAKRIEISPG